MTAADSKKRQARGSNGAAGIAVDMPREPALDSIVFIAAQLFRVPIAMLTIVEQDRAWSKASVGPLSRIVSTSDSFCTTTVLNDEMLVVEDAAADDRFSNLPIVTGVPSVRFYAGVPLHASDSTPIATLCVMDHQPRSVPDKARTQLLQLAREAERLLLQSSPS